jgi:dsRNA-specific ribonuclease
MEDLQIHYAPRDKRFDNFIRNILKLSNLTKKQISDLVDKNILLYEQVFTHKSANENINYEIYEFLGDTTVNKAIAWYLTRRYPQLACPKGVKILTRLKINLVSKKSFSILAKRLYFWNFVTASEEERQNRMNKILEDVFEAFFGLTEYLVDTDIQFGLGYAICYNIIHHLMEQENISLKYEDLFDAKTRLKEIFDYFKENIGILKYTSIRDIEAKKFFTKIFRIHEGVEYFLSEGEGPLKLTSEQFAAESAIQILKIQGFIRPLSDDMKTLCE